ncbi:hypothetical protein LUZ63_004775 [Rhynchospora breviuscula]|uniref:SWIM-type domain-containing protein n=1 Tax=Rhynchospora breviuscula TaxID=2022672 RepID=A0A9Q0CLP7_9POAL|nr:hypothetical protein LUZ63_004775 [Rhynchospora breviuscula]
MLTNSAQTGQMGEPLAGSIAVGTPGISASPLLAEFSSPKAGQGTELSTEVPQTEKPIEKLARLDMENSNNMPHVGERRKDKRDHLTKNPRAETRTACYLIPTQREVSEIALIDINLADLSGIRPKESHELLSRQAGGVRSIGYTKDDLSNCLRDMRKEAMEYGAAVAITKYFEKRTSENSFFQHFEDITENEEIANILWMDGRMLAAYARFGEVVIFDTTFGTNNEKWALGTFVGFNNFREIVIFGAALMCDQSTESFAWVFTKFLEANGDKRPITMFTDQDHAIGKALGQDAYTLGIRSTQSSESINSDLKDYLSCKMDINRFMKHFDRVVDAKREKEIKSEYDMTRKKPRVRYSIPILCEAGMLYTPNIFELFQKECELSGSTYMESIEGNTYTVGMYNISDEEFRKSRQVVWNRDDQSIACSCKKFERVGILCCHAIKVLDREDIKNIPPRYILKRWTQYANDEIVVDREGRVVIEDAMLEVRNRHAQLMRELAPISDMVTHDEGKTQFVLNGLRSLREQVEERYGNPSKRTNDCGEDNSISQLENSLHLKKKDGDNRSKRRKPWNENLSRRKKGNGPSISNSQPLIRPSANSSQDISEENFGCNDNLETI